MNSSCWCSSSSGKNTANTDCAAHLKLLAWDRSAVDAVQKIIDRCFPVCGAQNVRSCALSRSDETNTSATSATEFSSLVYVENVKLPTPHQSTSLKSLHSCSWSESKLLSQVEEIGRELIAGFAKRHMLRCYPSAKRITSDNYDPSLAWSVGAQMAALNFQADDISMWINRGKFLANGGCGFVRKPEYLIGSKLGPPNVPACTLNITVVACSGWTTFERFHSYETPTTYIRVSLAGSILDNKSCVTSAFSKRKQFGPYAQPFFNETFSFDIFEPRLSTLLFTVHAKESTAHDAFLAQSCFPVTLLRPGTRLVPLYDQYGKYVGEAGPLCARDLFLHMLLFHVLSEIVSTDSWTSSSILPRFLDSCNAPRRCHGLHHFVTLVLGGQGKTACMVVKIKILDSV